MTMAWRTCPHCGYRIVDEQKETCPRCARDLPADLEKQPKPAPDDDGKNRPGEG